MQWCRFRLGIGQRHCRFEKGDGLLVQQARHLTLAEIERRLISRLALVNVFEVRLGLLRLLRR